MGKYFNNFSNFGAVIGGGLAYLVGGFDSLVNALIILMCIDYLTGIIKAVHTKKLSSKIGFQGILKKILILSIVCVAVVCERDLGIEAVREIAIMFFCMNEGISILENASALDIPIPEKLKDALLQIRK